MVEICASLSLVLISVLSLLYFRLVTPSGIPAYSNNPFDNAYEFTCSLFHYERHIRYSQRVFRELTQKSRPTSHERSVANSID